MSRPSAPVRTKRRKEQEKKKKESEKARVVQRGQRAKLNGKPVIADGKGNWMPASHYDRYSKDFRKGKPVGTYVVGKDRSKGETAAERERRIFPETETEARRRIGSSGGRGAKGATRSQNAKDRARGDLAIKQGGGRTGEAYVGTGQPTTKPKAAGTKPAQTKKTRTKPKKDNRPTTVKEIEDVNTFINTYENKKGAMQNAVRQAKARLERLKEKRAKEVRGNRPRNA